MCDNDMDENIKQESEAREPEVLKRQYRALLQAAPDAIFVADAETGEIIEVNEAAEELRSQPREEIIGLHQSELHPDTGTDIYERLFEEHLEEEGKRRYNPDGSQIYAVDGDGREIPVEITANTIELPDGPIIYGTFQDISDRLERKRELRRFEQAVEAAGNAIFFADNTGEIYHANPALEEITGYSAEELIGETPSLLDSGEMRDGYFEDLWETVLDGDRWEEEIINQRKDGELYTALQTIAPFTVDGEIEGFVAVQTDITEEKERERRLRREKERLDEFASVVSHDLRNPLNVAQGRVELAQDECDTEHLDDAGAAIERSLELIEDLLMVARSGQEVREMESVSMAKLVDTCCSTIDTADASIVTDLETTIRADRSRLRQLFENLFHNAVEHGGEDVTVEIGPLPDGFYVEDDGTGIPEDARGDVFEYGYTESDDGSGFGLGIVEQIATAHGWDVRIGEGSENGARFEFTGVDVVTE